MRRSVILSAGMHVAFLAYAYFGLPDLFLRTPTISTPIPVEIVTIGEVSRAPAKKEEPKPEPPKPEPPKPEAKPEPPKVEPKPEPPPQPKEVAAAPPELPKAAPKPEPEPIPAPELKPQPKPVVAEPQSQQRALVDAPKPKPKPKQPEFDPTRLTALLDKRKQQSAAPLTPRVEEKQASVDSIQIKRPPSALPTSAQPTISELDFIRRQFLDCWSVPGGVRDIQTMRITIKVQIGVDGAQIGKLEIVRRNGNSFGNEQFFRTFEESALRAVRICNPLRLPPGDPTRWRELEFTFDPKDMLG